MTSEKCPYCGSNRTVKRGFRYAKVGKKPLRLCKSCSRKFTMEERRFLRMRYRKADILKAVKLYNSGYSLAEVKKHLEREDIDVSRWAIFLWLKKYGGKIRSRK